MKYKKVLVANRGEIAVRIIRALKELGIYSIAIYSVADKSSLHVKLANESVCIGEGNVEESYLNIYKIISVAKIKKVDAIHPGIGFLAENPIFCDICKYYNIDFIGPGSEIIQLMGNKCEAKRSVVKFHVPIIPGNLDYISSLDECYTIIKKIGLPIVIKAVSGGGGKGIRVVNKMEEVQNAYELCKKEAISSFSDENVMIEKYLENTRHIEIQIISDKFGNMIHLGDRECTIQRNKQKMIEESPCSNISDSLRRKLYDDAMHIAKKCNYVGPGTVEFLVLPDETYYFLEMNTRLQVEHTITEMVTGVDIVKEQMRVLGGQKLSFEQKDIQIKGYAMQCRIQAEDVKNHFAPSPGQIKDWNMPGGLGVRVDNGYKLGDFVPPYYDSLLTKICCFGNSKQEAVKKMQIALSETQVGGIKNNIDFLKYIISQNDFLCGNYNEKFIEKLLGEYKQLTCN